MWPFCWCNSYGGVQGLFPFSLSLSLFLFSLSLFSFILLNFFLFIFYSLSLSFFFLFQAVGESVTKPLLYYQNNLGAVLALLTGLFFSLLSPSLVYLSSSLILFPVLFYSFSSLIQK